MASILNVIGNLVADILPHARRQEQEANHNRDEG